MRAGAIRADKWLWQARFFKTRAASAAMIAAGHLRVNGQRAARPAHPVVPGDVLTFVQGRAVRVVRVLAPGLRRGPATEAQSLYADMAAASVQDGVSAPPPVPDQPS